MRPGADQAAEETASGHALAGWLLSMLPEAVKSDEKAGLGAYANSTTSVAA